MLLPWFSETYCTPSCRIWDSFIGHPIEKEFQVLWWSKSAGQFENLPKKEGTRSPFPQEYIPSTTCRFDNCNLLLQKLVQELGNTSNKCKPDWPRLKINKMILLTSFLADPKSQIMALFLVRSTRIFWGFMSLCEIESMDR